MSLDVYLTGDVPQKLMAGSGIFVRKNGATVEITREEQNRLNASFDSIQKLILQWSKIREHYAPPAPSPAETFPTHGDNFTTLSDENVARPTFGKRPRTDTPDGVA